MPEYNYYKTVNWLYRNTDSEARTKNLERFGSYVRKNSSNWYLVNLPQSRTKINFEPITEAQAVTIILTGDLDA